MMKNNIFQLPSKMSKNFDWLLYWPIFFSLQVMNRTTNTRTLLFSQHKSLDLCFHREKIAITLRERTFYFFKRIVFFLLFPNERRKHISSFLFLKREREDKTYSFSGFPRRENSHSEIAKPKKPSFLFYFNSGSFRVVLELLETAPLISPIYWVGLGWVNPLRHPNPSPTLNKAKRNMKDTTKCRIFINNGKRNEAIA